VLFEKIVFFKEIIGKLVRLDKQSSYSNAAPATVIGEINRNHCEFDSWEGDESGI